MKKFLSVICLLAMMLTMLVSCEEHEHVFDTDNWVTDDDYHWHACTAVDGCPEVDDKDEHEFEVVEGKDGKMVNQCKVCGETNDKIPTAPEHEHNFSDKLTGGDNYHWYACTVEGCYEQKDKKEHAFGNPEVTYEDSKITTKYVCVDCAFEKIEEQAVKTEVDDALSWNDAFKQFKLTNFTMDVNFFFKEQNMKHNNHCVVTEEDAYYCIPDSNEFYTFTNEDGTYTTYKRRGSNDPFVLLKDKSSTYLVGAQTETVLQVSFEENFDKFTYDAESGSYVCADPIEAKCFTALESTETMTLYCYNNVVKIVDGKISYIEASYYFDKSELEIEDKSFKYYNIGISAVEMPQSVIDNAIKEGEASTGNANDSLTQTEPMPEKVPVAQD